MKTNKHAKRTGFTAVICLVMSVCIMLMTGCSGTPALTNTTSAAATEPTSGEAKNVTKIGVATACTNPPEDIDMKGFTLTGFGNIARRYDGKMDDLEMSCIAFEINGVKTAIIAADTLGWDKDLTDALRAKVEKELGIPADSLLFNASHTHSGFNTLTNTHGLGNPVKEYQDFFYETAFNLIKEAFDDLEEGTLYTGFTTASYVSISRRAIINGVCEWLPSSTAPRNDETTVIKAVCGDKVKAIVFGFGCHPSTLNGNYSSADYVGRAREEIEKEFEGTTAIFMQNCGADVKTRILNAAGTAFAAGGEQDIITFGKRLATAVIRLCKSDEMEEVTGNSSYEITRFDIPLAKNTRTKADYDKLRKSSTGVLPDADKLRKSSTGVLPDVYKWFYENYENLPTSIPYSIQRIDLGDKFSIVALEGEVVSEYDPLISALMPDRTVMVAGYSNGEIGYICLERMYTEGGYEPYRSCDYYGIPENFSPEIENIIMSHAKELCA